MKTCPRCGSVCDDFSSFCDNCGYAFRREGEAGQHGPGYGPQSGNPQYGGYGQQPYIPPRRNGYSVASLVLGIIGAVFFCDGIGIVPSILAIVFGAVASRSILASGGRECGLGMSRAGIVLGIIGLSLIAVIIVLVIFFSLSVPFFFNNINGTQYTA